MTAYLPVHCESHRVNRLYVLALGNAIMNMNVNVKANATTKVNAALNLVSCPAPFREKSRGVWRWEGVKRRMAEMEMGNGKWRKR